QGNQDTGRPQGAKDANRRYCRPGASETRCCSAAARGRRHLSFTRERYDRRRGVDRSVRRREARFSQSRALLLLSGLVGRWSKPARVYQSRQVERAAKELSSSDYERGELRQYVDAGAL